jgi:hypothetical protein
MFSALLLHQDIDDAFVSWTFSVVARVPKPLASDVQMKCNNLKSCVFRPTVFLFHENVEIVLTVFNNNANGKKSVQGITLVLRVSEKAFICIFSRLACD